MSPRLPIITLLSLSTLSVLAIACAGTRYTTVFEKDRTTVRLRSESRSGSAAGAFDHPTTISSARIVNIFSSIDIRDPKKKKNPRRPAFPLSTIYAVAEGVSMALAKATPDQEVVVQSLEVRKETGIFDHFYLTNFVAYVKDDHLIVSLGYIDHEIEMNKTKRLPEPRTNKLVGNYRVIPGRSITPVGAHAVQVDWRASIFRKSQNIRTLPGGRVVRRQILMQMEIPEDEEDIGALPSIRDLAPSTLRRLADLEEERRNGSITEGQYNARHREIMRSDPASSR